MARLRLMLPDNPNYSKIEEGLYLGNLSAAVDRSFLSSCRISHILTLEYSPLPLEITSIPGMKFLHIKVGDISTEDLLTHFEEAIAFIEEGQKIGNVYVHCYFGISRSATLVCCFLMWKYRISVDEALKRMKEKRGFVSPNPGFLAQLILFQDMEWKLDYSDIKFRQFQLRMAARMVSYGKVIDRERYDVFTPDPQISLSPGDTVAYKCKSCRYSLISARALLLHVPGKRFSWNADCSTAETCQQGIFTFPIAWMSQSLTEGKIYCPKCNGKLGSFNWVAGRQCACGVEITPGFYFVPSKLDSC